MARARELARERRLEHRPVRVTTEHGFVRGRSRGMQQTAGISFVPRFIQLMYSVSLSAMECVVGSIRNVWVQGVAAFSIHLLRGAVRLLCRVMGAGLSNTHADSLCQSADAIHAVRPGSQHVLPIHRFLLFARRSLGVADTHARCLIVRISLASCRTIISTRS